MNVCVFVCESEGQSEVERVRGRGKEETKVNNRTLIVCNRVMKVRKRECMSF